MILWIVSLQQHAQDSTWLKVKHLTFATNQGPPSPSKHQTTNRKILALTLTSSSAKMAHAQAPVVTSGLIVRQKVLRINALMVNA